MWDPTLTAHSEPLLDKAEVIEGGTLDMTDNPKYCVFARFCHPEGDAWSLTEQSSAPEARRMAIREGVDVPRRPAHGVGQKFGKPFEFRFEPSLGLIEDVTIGSSGGLWIRGGIALRRETGKTYEIRNRVVVCRCRTVGEQALLRRHARRDQMARQPRRGTCRRNASRGGLLNGNESPQRLSFPVYSIAPLRAAASIQQSAIRR